MTNKQLHKNEGSFWGRKTKRTQKMEKTQSIKENILRIEKNKRKTYNVICKFCTIVEYSLEEKYRVLLKVDYSTYLFSMA